MVFCQYVSLSVWHARRVVVCAGRHGSAVVEESLGSLRSQVTLPEVSDRVQTLRHMLFLHSESGAASVEGAGRVEEGPGSPPVSQGGSAEPPRRGISAEQQQAPHGDEELEGAC